MSNLVGLGWGIFWGLTTGLLLRRGMIAGKRHPILWHVIVANSFAICILGARWVADDFLTITNKAGRDAFEWAWMGGLIAGLMPTFVRVIRDELGKQ